MSRSIGSLVAVCFVLLLAASAVADQAVELRLKDGGRWRGELNDKVEVTYIENDIEATIAGSLIKVADLYVIVEGNIAGDLRQKVIFQADVVSVRTLGGEDPDPLAEARTRPTDRPGEQAADDKAQGVFVLPLSGPVGINIRHEEIEAIAKEADKYGPGQIIVLIMETDGGLVSESQKIADLLWEVKKRHRVVAWIAKAYSAGCWIAMCCDEIYFMTEGAAGSVTTIMMGGPGGPVAVPEEQVQKDINDLVAVATQSGHSEHIARSMKLKKYMCSYDKDPETGEVTFYGDLSGEFVLSDGESNLSFTSSIAEHCGFSRGTADTEEDLGELLRLPEWNEKSDYGRRISTRWNDLVERCKNEVPHLWVKRGRGVGGTTEEELGYRIRINEDLIRWIERCPNACVYEIGLPPKEIFERENEELRKQLGDIKRNKRRG